MNFADKLALGAGTLAVLGAIGFFANVSGPCADVLTMLSLLIVLVGLPLCIICLAVSGATRIRKRKEQALSAEAMRG